ncbi:primosomal protein N' [Glaciecola siphonariae]|uniref:Replication restart protein PriA n=1 Tax=Glaciecola siphonariae TaxID=521012 RepID=A0ABV9LVF9_9ALTE
MSDKFLTVAVPVPLRKSFDYLIPAELSQQQDWIGCRVQVPFGRRQLVGVVIASSNTSETPEAKLKAISARLDNTPVLDNKLLRLGAWMAQYYLHAIGEVYALLLPSALRKGGASLPADIPYIEKCFGQLSDVHESLKQAKKQLALCAAIACEAKPLSEIRAAYSASIIKDLQTKGLIRQTNKAYKPDTSWPERLLDAEHYGANIEQSIAISAINQAKGFASFLLEGVTGSGKTEVYLQVIEPRLAKGQQVLILVPEIGLTPQTVKRFEQRFGNIVGVLHSGLNDTQRLRIWQQAQANELGIVIGTRSSIFTPFAQLGMIIVDEEHDESFKQQDGVKYHARDIAVYRANQLNIPLIMGSATPSLETLHNAFIKKYHHCQLTQRAANASMPTQLLLDVKGQALKLGIAQGLIDKMQTQLAQGNQVLVFVHRRGYSPALLCHQCGHVETCVDCDNPYTVHKVSNNLQCHRCCNQRSIPRQCQQCGHKDLDTFGLGTEQIEQGMASLFPDYSCVRIDSDSTRGKGKLSHLLEQINAQTHQILIGTQILSKGHHFPNVTLAIILNVDGSLFSADFRAPEKLGQLITQLSGRAGRANKPGEVWLQTHHPQHPLLQDLVQNGFADYARSLLLERKEACLPPYEYQILLRVESANMGLITPFLNDAASLLSQLSKLKVIGPLPCAIEKKQGRFRMMLLIQSASRSYLHKALNDALPIIESHANSSKIRWSLDVSPLDFT